MFFPFFSIFLLSLPGFNTLYISNCERNSSIGLGCAQCKPGYGQKLNDNSQCFPCNIPNCRRCDIRNDQAWCNECNSGFFPYLRECYSPQQLMPGCLKFNNLTCTECDTLSKFHLDQGTCLKCETFSVSLNKCITCDSLIKNCELCSYLGDSCYACSPKYQLINNTCVLKCPQTYYPYNNQCILCNLTNPYCQECIDGSICTLCEAKTFKKYAYNPGIYAITCSKTCDSPYYYFNYECIQCDDPRIGKSIILENFNLQCNKNCRSGYQLFIHGYLQFCYLLNFISN